jgi:hypothetical protein
MDVEQSLTMTINRICSAFPDSWDDVALDYYHETSGVQERAVYGFTSAANLRSAVEMPSKAVSRRLGAE